MKRSLAVWMCLIVAVSFAFAAQAQEVPNCPGAPVPRLTVGSAARVLPGDPNNVRDSASRSGAQIGQIPGGEPFDVLDGPVCADDLNWWQVQYGDLVGWTVEGAGSDYWVEPVAEAPTEATPAPEPTPVPNVPPQAVPEFVPPITAENVPQIGAQVRVINDDPASETITLTVRAEPGRNAGGLAQALEGDLLTITGGPEEADGLRWWQVETARGTTGWVVEGLLNGDSYERTLLAVCPFTEGRFVYRVGDYVVTSAADGSDPCVLDRISINAWSTFNATPVTFDNHFVVSPDGASMMYADRLAADSSSDTALYRLTLDGSERIRLTNGINIYWASWSPDGQKIAVATGAHIGIVPADGSSYSTLTQAGDDRYWVEWLADNESVIYLEQDRLSDQMGTAVDYVFRQINTQAGGLRDALDPSLGWDPVGFVISPDRTQLAVRAVEYALLDGMSGSEPAKFYDIDHSISATTRIIDLVTGEVIVEADFASYERLIWLRDGSAVLSLDSALHVIPVSGEPAFTLEPSGDTLPSEYWHVLGWEDDTTLLIYVGFGFQIETEDRGIWAVDITTGAVERR